MPDNRAINTVCDQGFHELCRDHMGCRCQCHSTTEEPTPIFGAVVDQDHAEGADAVMHRDGDAVIVLREDGSREVFAASEVRDLLGEAA